MGHFSQLRRVIELTTVELVQFQTFCPLRCPWHLNSPICVHLRDRPSPNVNIEHGLKIKPFRLSTLIN
jgi:hypothetical protein